MQPTASKAGTLLQCAWAFNNPAVPKTIANVSMRYGSAFHSVVAAALEAGVAPKISTAAIPSAAKEFGVENVEQELRAHTQAAYAELLHWLGGGNPWGLKLLPAPKKGVILVEQAIAYDVMTGKARLAPPVDENHVYHDVTDSEHPGTFDVAINLKAYGTRVPVRFRKAVLILDHKTGMTFDNPRDSAQLRSLAVACCALWGCERAVVAINHAPRDGIPAIFADELGPEDLVEHAAALKRAFARIGDGSLRPGPQCGYCAGNSVCPAYGGSLATLTDGLRAAYEGDGAAGTLLPVVAGRAPLSIDTPEGLGTVHMILQMMRRVDDEWAGRIKEKLKSDPGFFGVRPDGKFTVLRKTERDNLSMASIKRAVGNAEAARIEKMLRAKGCIERIEREELREVDDR